MEMARVRGEESLRDIKRQKNSETKNIFDAHSSSVLYFLSGAEVSLSYFPTKNPNFK